eukprot:TRINITY_DN6216_c0_g1_i1.p1 TRINITY_DN6216_c0_g1~~TRINITY_DN6216_c0_g1_i1.p1  ORF type:complete len:799 (+),score=186.08 TRINITY_DN6216_c0_g1_i1:86-2398(+)
MLRALCAPLVRRATGPKVTDLGEALAIEIAVPFSAAVCAVLAVLSALGAAELAQWDWEEAPAAGAGCAHAEGRSVFTLSLAAHWAGLSAAAFFLGAVLLRRRLPLRLAEGFLLALAAAVICDDWGSAARGQGDAWPLGMVVVDVLLALGARRCTVLGVVGAVTLWLVLRSAEDLFRLGLWDWPYRTGTARPAWLEAHRSGEALIAASCALSRLIPFLANFVIVRSYVDSLRRSESVSQRMAELLGAYDLGAARELLLSPHSRDLTVGMRLALARLLQNLASYKAFLPQSCLVVGGSEAADYGGEADEVTRDMSEGSCRTSPSPSPRFADANRCVHMVHDADTSLAPSLVPPDSFGSFPMGGAASALSDMLAHSSQSRRSSLQSAGKSSRLAMSPMDAPLFLRNQNSLGSGPSTLGPVPGEAPELKRKPVTLVVSNLRGYLRALQQSSNMEMASFHHQLTAKLVVRVGSARGLIDAVSGDRMTASLNAARTVASHRLGGLRLAWELASSLQVVHRSGSAVHVFAQRKRRSSSPTHRGRASMLALQADESDCTLHASVASGDVACGVLGSESLRRYQYVGPAAAWVHIQERLATRWGAAVVLNEVVKADSEAHFLFRLREMVDLAKPSYQGAPPHAVWEAVHQWSEQEHQEWMYQLAERDEANPWKAYNHARRVWFRGDREAAVHLCASGKTKHPELRVFFDELTLEISQFAGTPSVRLEEVHISRRPRSPGSIRPTSGSELSEMVSSSVAPPPTVSVPHLASFGSLQSAPR